jgi:hypothetical protein
MSSRRSFIKKIAVGSLSIGFSSERVSSSDIIVNQQSGTSEENQNNIDFLGGKVIDYLGNSVAGIEVTIRGTNVSSGRDNELISQATTSADGRFEFDGEVGEAIRLSDLDNYRSKFESASILIYDKVTADTPAMTAPSNPLFFYKYFNGTELFSESEFGTFVLTEEWIDRPPLLADEIPYEPSVWRKYDPENPNKQTLFFEVIATYDDSGFIPRTMKSCSLSIELPQTVTVDYDNVRILKSEYENVGDTKTPANTPNTPKSMERPIPYYSRLNNVSSVYENEGQNLSEEQRNLVESVFGEVSGALTGGASAIWELANSVSGIALSDTKYMGGGSNDFNQNDEDIIQRGVQASTGYDISSAILIVPVEFDFRKTIEIGMGGNWEEAGIANQNTYIYDDGATIAPSVINILPIGESRPTDPDNDGFYEDINGDGSLSEADVTLLAENIESENVKNNPSAYDFNGNGRVDYADVVALSKESE